LIRKPVKSLKTHARPAKRASAAIVVPVVKAAVVDAVKAVATVDRAVMADGAKAAATVAHAKSAQKAKTRAGVIPTMCQLS
jgi:hypothetical protein